MRYQTNIKLYPRSASISGQRVDLVKDENYLSVQTNLIGEWIWCLYYWVTNETSNSSTLHVIVMQDAVKDIDD